MRYRPRLLVALAASAVILVPPTASAASDPYGADPLRLVPFLDTVQQVYSAGADDWEVWVCRSPNYAPAVTNPVAVVDALNAEITPFFEWLSGGSFRPVFRFGGTVTTDQVIAPDPNAPEQRFAQPCEDLVAGSAKTSPQGVVIITDAPVDEGYATAGAVCPDETYGPCTSVYPDNARVVVLGAATVVRIEPFEQPQWITVAHEIGHSLNWAHSYGGRTLETDGRVSRYDNPMDVMSGGYHTGNPIGTIAYNRYAAGWIDPGDVIVHTSGLSTYQLSADFASGPQMLVIPSSDPGRFYMLGARRRTGYDAALISSGVEVYEVDQRRGIACQLPAGLPPTWPCFATFVRIAQEPALVGLDQTDHVLGIDDTVTLERFEVAVVAASTTGFTIRVSEFDSGRFTDDDRNVHESNIEKIAAAGLTAGCNPPANDRYCPLQSVTRAEMAVFLTAALDLIPAAGYQGYFSDVAEGAWYAPYVEALYAAEITVGYDDGTYRPDSTVTRREMAVFLFSAFGDGTLDPASGVFTDVSTSSWYAPYVEEIYRSGTTAGCSLDPVRFCPAAPVLRDQMATFLATALGL